MMKKGISIIEVLFLSGVVALLVVIAVPSYLKAIEEWQRHACISNLREIEQAKARWAESKNLTNGSPVVVEEVLALLKDPSVTNCPAGGTISFNAIGSHAACNAKGGLHVISH